MSQTENPLLIRARMPGRTFTLPSKGMFYTNQELDESVTNGEILVQPMVTFDELAFRSADKLLNGTAVAEVFSRCVPQVKKPLDMLSKDVDYLMVCLRLVSYGQEYQFEYAHDCENAKPHSYTTDLQEMLRKTHALDPAGVASEFKLTLPNSQVVTLRPSTFANTLRFFQTMNKPDMTLEEGSMNIINAMIDTIVSVDGVKDRVQIEEWLRNIPAGYVRQLTIKTADLSGWGIVTTDTIQCKDCGAAVEVDLPLNPINFFS